LTHETLDSLTELVARDIRVLEAEGDFGLELWVQRALHLAL
jgi:hypothetical protein